MAKIFRLAARYRQRFQNDVVIDLIGYRKNGHNEIDEPSFTQPIMYETIKNHPTALSQYQSKLVAEGRLSQDDVAATTAFVQGSFDDAFAAAPDYVSPADEWFDSPWKDMKNPNLHSGTRTTGVSLDTLKQIGEVLPAVPEGFNVHRRLNNMILKAKAKTLEAGEGLDWGTAEALAFGSLLLEGTHVRISGQDAQRGTFSHRHAVWTDQKVEGVTHTPLNHVAQEGQEQAQFVCHNSHLSEFGVMGFELGNSQEDPNALVIWEAQFGDFVNGAQIIIDQFISSGEAKWMRQSGLVLLLPHQYQGQGPEHSSARVERFLQSCDEDPDEVPNMDPETTMQIQNHNWQIVNCSTPANYFHVLRRQQHRDFRKPLVVVAPKGLLRLKNCSSSFEDMAEGTQFKTLIPEREPDTLVADDQVRRLVFCSGAFYYDLIGANGEIEKKILEKGHTSREGGGRGCDDVAVVTIEQIAPFPFDLVAEQIAKYPNAEVVWAQEEPKNMGAWQYVQDRIMTASRVLNGNEVRPAYVGRKTMASPAEGWNKVHLNEQSNLVITAFSDRVTTSPVGEKAE